MLHERRHREGDIDRLVCRVCDPLEYGSEEVAEIFRRTVNEVIALEGLIITNVAGRPVLATLDRSGAATYSAPADLNHRLQELILDDETARLLIDRVRETEICAANGAYTFAIIGIGSFVEGLLQTVLSERDEHIRVHGFLDDQGKALHDRRISLHYLINLARSRSWIQLDAADFMHKVREYRNYVHPRVQQQDPQDFDRDSVMLCWAPVRAVLNDLEEYTSPACSHALNYSPRRAVVGSALILRADGLKSSGRQVSTFPARAAPATPATWCSAAGSDTRCWPRRRPCGRVRDP